MWFMLWLLTLAVAIAVCCALIGTAESARQGRNNFHRGL